MHNRKDLDIFLSTLLPRQRQLPLRGNDPGLQADSYYVHLAEEQNIQNNTLTEIIIWIYIAYIKDSLLRPLTQQETLFPSHVS